MHMSFREVSCSVRIFVVEGFNNSLPYSGVYCFNALLMHSVLFTLKSGLGRRAEFVKSKEKG